MNDNKLIKIGVKDEYIICVTRNYKQKIVIINYLIIKLLTLKKFSI